MHETYRKEARTLVALTPSFLASVRAPGAVVAARSAAGAAQRWERRRLERTPVMTSFTCCGFAERNAEASAFSESGIGRQPQRR